MLRTQPNQTRKRMRERKLITMIKIERNRKPRRKEENGTEIETERVCERVCERERE